MIENMIEMNASNTKLPIKVIFNGVNIADDCVSMFCCKEPNTKTLGIVQIIEKDKNDVPIFQDDGKLKTKMLIGQIEWYSDND